MVLSTSGRRGAAAAAAGARCMIMITPMHDNAPPSLRRRGAPFNPKNRSLGATRLALRWSHQADPTPCGAEGQVHQSPVEAKPSVGITATARGGARRGWGSVGAGLVHSICT